MIAKQQPDKEPDDNGFFSASEIRRLNRINELQKEMTETRKNVVTGVLVAGAVFGFIAAVVFGAMAFCGALLVTTWTRAFAVGGLTGTTVFIIATIMFQNSIATQIGKVTRASNREMRRLLSQQRESSK